VGIPVKFVACTSVYKSSISTSKWKLAAKHGGTQN